MLRHFDDPLRKVKNRMKKIDWVALAREESHWGLFYALNPPTPLPRLSFWVNQRSLDRKTKTGLEQLGNDDGLLQLLRLKRISERAIVSILVFGSISEGWFDLTIKKLNDSPQQFAYEKDTWKLKQAHMMGNLVWYMTKTNPLLLTRGAKKIAQRIMAHFGSITNRLTGNRHEK